MTEELKRTGLAFRGLSDEDTSDEPVELEDEVADGGGGLEEAPEDEPAGESSG
ncbi:MAG: hypothetical protein AAB655_01435 [Patescibacteria group bacterium]